MTNPEQPKTGSVTAGVKSSLDGTFTANVKLKLEGFKLGDLSERIGQLSVFGGELEIRYPFAVGKVQADLSLNYLHWKLPELGPLLSEVVLRKAFNYGKDTWGLSEGMELRLRNTYVRNLEVRLGLDFRVEGKNNGSSAVTHGVVTNLSATYSF